MDIIDIIRKGIIGRAVIIFMFFASIIAVSAFSLYAYPYFKDLAVLAVPVAVGTAATLFAILTSNRAAREARIRIERIEVKAEKEPEKVKFAWELASAKLEAYFDRNLMQVFLIFVVAIVAMLVGFGFVLWGVSLAIRNPGQNTSWIAAVSGIITEFIGVTFMVIYRSTMSQANSFMQVLERINTVGMAVQILDSIPESDLKLKNTTRAELVNLLFKNAAVHKTELEKA